MLNSIGLQGPGIDAFLARDLPWLLQHDARLIVSIAGSSLEEYTELADGSATAPARRRRSRSTSPARTSRTAASSSPATRSVRPGGAAVRRAAALAASPIFAKLSPDVTTSSRSPEPSLEAGADGLTMINTLLGHGHRHRPHASAAGGVTGGLSGPAVRPVAVRALWQVTAAMREGCRPAHRGGRHAHRRGRPRVRRRRRVRRAGRHRDVQRPVASPPGASTSSRPKSPAIGFTRFADVVGIAHDRRRPTHDEQPRRPPSECGLRGAMDARRPAVRRHRPAREPARVVGAAGRPVRARAVRDDLRRGVRRRVAVLKPQSAFFEGYGSAGRRRARAGARATCATAGALAILDAKRGDIGSTMEAYAQAFLDRRGSAAGRRHDGEPLPRLRVAAPRARPGRRHRRGRLRARPDLQPGGPAGAARRGRRPLRRRVRGRRCRRRQRGRRRRAASSGTSGLVVGATVGDAVARLGLDLAASAAPLLAPGLGAQGAGPRRPAVGLRRRDGQRPAERLALGARPRGPSVAAPIDAARAGAEAVRAASDRTGAGRRLDRRDAARARCA